MLMAISFTSHFHYNPYLRRSRYYGREYNGVAVSGGREKKKGHTFICFLGGLAGSDDDIHIYTSREGGEEGEHWRTICFFSF